MKHFMKPIVTAVVTSTLSFNVLSAEIKNVILMIGDGMGPQQVGLLETYETKRQIPSIKGTKRPFINLLKKGLLVHP